MKFPEAIRKLQAVAQAMQQRLYKSSLKPTPRMDCADPYRKLARLWYGANGGDWKTAEEMLEVLPEKAVAMAGKFMDPNVQDALNELNADLNKLKEAVYTKNMKDVQEWCEEFYISFLILQIEILYNAAFRSRMSVHHQIATDYSNQLDVWLDENVEPESPENHTNS